MKPVSTALFALLSLASATLPTTAQGQPNAAPPPAASAQAQAYITRAALAQGMYELAYSPRQQAVFAVSSGGRGEGAAASRVLRLDPATLAIQGEIALERRGFGMALDDAAGRLYIGNTTDASVTVIDVTNQKVIATIQLAEKITNPEGRSRYPHGFRQLVLDPSRHRLYMPGLAVRDSALYVVDTRRLAVEAVVPGLGFVATGATLDDTGDKLYVSNLQGQLFTIDTRALSIERKVEVQADQLLNLAYDSKQRRLLATDQGLTQIDGMRKQGGGLTDYQPRGTGNRVVVLDPVSGELLRSVPTGDGPISLKIDEARNRLYVTNRLAGTVTVFDSRHYAALHTLALPSHPNSLTLDAATGVVYVSVKNNKQEAGTPESVARITLP